MLPVTAELRFSRPPLTPTRCQRTRSTDRGHAAAGRTEDLAVPAEVGGESSVERRWGDGSWSAVRLLARSSAGRPAAAWRRCSRPNRAGRAGVLARERDQGPPAPDYPLGKFRAKKSKNSATIAPRSRAFRSSASPASPSLPIPGTPSSEPPSRTYASLLLPIATKSK